MKEYQKLWTEVIDVIDSAQRFVGTDEEGCGAYVPVQSKFGFDFNSLIPDFSGTVQIGDLTISDPDNTLPPSFRAFWATATTGQFGNLIDQVFFFFCLFFCFSFIFSFP